MTGGWTVKKEPGGNFLRNAYIAALIGFVFMTVLFIISKALTDPNIPYLQSEQGAQWIRFPEQTKLKVRWDGSLKTYFRATFETGNPPQEAILNFRALKAAEIKLNGKVLHDADEAQPQEWKKKRRIDLASALLTGQNELHVEVRNHNGHPAFIAHCLSLSLRTGGHWEASLDGRSWHKALLVDDTPPLPLSRSFERADRALLAVMHLYLPVFLMAFFLAFAYTQKPRPAWTWILQPSASAVRWGVMVLWVILAVNNISKIPLDVGMDIKGHMQYVTYLHETMRIPLATEGWQTFQPPFFYMLSALFYRILLFVLSPELAAYALRIIPLCCGIIQVELCYRTLRYAYPTRNDLQAVGTVLGGLLPMNLYMSQFVGNEPLAACLTALVVLMVFKILSSPSAVPQRRDLILTGLLLGLAVLSKMSAMLLSLPIVVCLFVKAVDRESGRAELMRDSLRTLILVFGLAFLVSGWYYLRNWMEMGQFIVTGWDSARNIIWWQDPGYRTPGQLLGFGEALFYPVYSAAVGFWDGLYSTFWMDGYLSAYNRPPWNYRFMLSSAWLSLVPTAIILTGMAASLPRSTGRLHQGLFFAFFSVVVYVSAIFYIYLSLPIISSAKASYALGLISCTAVLFVRGFDLLAGRFLFVKAALYGVMACWALAAYASYFVL